MRSRTSGMWWGTALEAPDPGLLARFYAELLEWPIVHEEPGTAVVAPPQGAVYIAFQEAPGYRPPVWPPADGAQRTMMHLDFRVADLDEAVAEAVALGASLAPEQPQAHVRGLFDPAGHPFCLCRDDGWRSVRTSPARGTTAGCAPCVRASGWSPVARRGR
ncbi:VOC family protein [Streptomyces sp. NPDC090075]|uniref:VOC family protein n=1 Tax=Streptomyces sp. NPDC090075 TaxID=3365937 RepID=UPI0037FD0DF3